MNTITLEHKRSGRTIVVSLFREDSLSFMAFDNACWACYSKHEWEKIA